MNRSITISVLVLSTLVLNGCGGGDDNLSNSTNNVAAEKFALETNIASQSGENNTRIAAGFNHTVAVDKDGKVFAWGNNSSGELGNSSFLPSYLPVQVLGMNRVKSVSAGGLHTLALKQDGTVWAWGNNNSGQAGIASYVGSATPMPVVGLSGIKAISANNSQSLALRNDGRVWGWGSNDYNLTIKRVPTAILGLSNVKAISTGGYHALALTKDGKVWGWGNNYYGQIGNANGLYISSNSPVRVLGLSNVKSISAGMFHSLAITNDGSIWAWGNNAHGQLGVANIGMSTVPMQIAGLQSAITGMNSVKAVSAGTYHSTVVFNNGTVRGWGWNMFGQLGNGTTNDTYTPTSVLGLNNVVSITSGYVHNTVVTKNGSVFSFGSNYYGQLGNGSNIHSSVPVQVVQPYGAKGSGFLNIGAK